MAKTLVQRRKLLVKPKPSSTRRPRTRRQDAEKLAVLPLASSNSRPSPSSSSSSARRPQQKPGIRRNRQPPRQASTKNGTQTASTARPIIPLKPYRQKISPSSKSRKHGNLRAPAIPAAEPTSRKANEDIGPPTFPSTDKMSSLHERISSKFDDVISSMDDETFSGGAMDLVIHQEPRTGLQEGRNSQAGAVPKSGEKSFSSVVLGANYFAKVKLYVNSKLPSNLPPLRLEMHYWPLICLAAQYSRRAYDKPVGDEREAFVNADWGERTKAMIIKSVPVDRMNCIVFAIRGTQTFMDWTVNLNSALNSPGEFLDDPGNLCHRGFLSVARKMIKSVAARLRSLLEENSSRRSCSLLITGHSAGGAVASLLYAHMLSQDIQSELSLLTGCFKRVHCVTFGSPPISLLPLTKPKNSRHKKSLFLSFINEGDPVSRADKAYVRSLLNLFASPPPGKSMNFRTARVPELNLSIRPKTKESPSVPLEIVNPLPRRFRWKLPPGTLSNAGSLVLLRELNSNKSDAGNDIKAYLTYDQQLREAVFGDPVMHMMSVYTSRVERLATRAITAKIWG